MGGILIVGYLVFFDAHSLPENQIVPTTSIQPPLYLREAHENCLIKGNIGFKTKEKIYHLPDCPYYSATKIDERYGERWFCTEQEAIFAGWRKAYNCP